MIETLIQLIGKEKVSRSASVLYRHSRDESPHSAVEPDVVCFPTSTEDVVAIVQYANEHHIPITPFGVGSGLEGQAIPLEKGISLSLEKMNKIRTFSEENMTVTVEPGITRMQLNEKINRHGLQFPIDPGADATIGGMVATNASGTTAVRYGVMREQILDLEVVLADGRVIHTGTEAKKSSSGYHLTGLIAGSEGTLGIITKITLQLHGIPEHVVAARCTFPTIEACAEAAYLVLASDIPVVRMELVDAESIQTVNDYGDYHIPAYPSLFFEFAGTKEATEAEARLVQGLMKEMDCNHWELASSQQARNEIWRARHEMAYAYQHKRGKNLMITDVCVPIAKLAPMIQYARQLLADYSIEGGLLGHVGDGNFHTFIVFDPQDPAEIARVDKYNDTLVKKAIAVGGTCTGEHAVGIGKRKFQQLEHGQAFEVMKQIKALFDPNNILNPGKIF